ncbi:MAG: mechanosensitive ion channel family protein [Microcoleaceae cyanobacterium MO_207.B10]|nr:mechanosensitive ion channel family protein [Microcoleaceae cyanobacterium MO_207.B10]
MVRKFIRILTFLLSITLLVLTLTLTWEFPTIAQTIPGLGMSADEEISVNYYVPVFKRGNLEIAPVFLDGKIVGTIASFIQLKSNTNNNQASIYSAAVRSQLIHTKAQKILTNMTRYTQEVLPKRGIYTIEDQEKELRKQLVTTSSENNGTAFVSVTFPQNDVPEIVFSVTQADIERPRFGGSQPLRIVEISSKNIENKLIQAWKERQSPYLLAQAQLAMLVLVGLTCTSLTLGWIQKQVTIGQRKLRDSLLDSETIQPEDNQTSSSSKITEKFIAIAPQFDKLSIEQRYSLYALYSSTLFWTQWLIWLLGIGYISSLFYWTRSWSNWMIGVTIRGSRAEEVIVGWAPLDWILSFGQEASLGTPLFILLLLLVARLSIKGGDALSDFFARRWSEQKSIQKRQTLRVSTLARVSKAWLRAIVYLLLGVTLLHHLHQLGTFTQVVTVFLGFISFALSLASQNLLKDLIAGLMILSEDQYAVGDWIIIDGQNGLVQTITLRVTKLRNLDGELITIPNGSIGVVRNLSSEWSQVNYAIEVAYDADVDRVMGVMEAIAQQLYCDPQWQNQILEAPKVLGVDKIAHTGIEIRLIIKTQPMQQWLVGREFRRRLKKAFDEQGIEVGVPQQVMYINGPVSKTNNGNFKINSQN